jgi:hypothetical protein
VDHRDVKKERLTIKEKAQVRGTLLRHRLQTRRAKKRDKEIQEKVVPTRYRTATEKAAGEKVVWGEVRAT